MQWNSQQDARSHCPIGNHVEGDGGNLFLYILIVKPHHARYIPLPKVVAERFVIT